MSSPAQNQHRRSGWALCLSGGAYRAALFHLGALTRLNELGILSKVDTISSVSGGSLLAAFLAAQVGGDWPEDGRSIPRWRATVLEPFCLLCSRNLRGFLIAAGLLAIRPFHETPARSLLAARLAKWLPELRLPQLPTHPRFIFCATDLVFGEIWRFDSGPEDGGSMGHESAGLVTPMPDWPLAVAIAASCSFPPFFPPIRVQPSPAQRKTVLRANPDWEKSFGSFPLSDGGLVDLLGIEPIQHSHAGILLSDGGETFEPELIEGSLSYFERFLTISKAQASILRKHWLHQQSRAQQIGGGVWSIEKADSDGVDDSSPGYGRQFIDDIVEEVRTDFDSFSPAECAVLVNHGYFRAEAAIKQSFGHLVSNVRDPIPPFEEWMDEQRAREALRDSHRRTILGRRVSNLYFDRSANGTAHGHEEKQ